MSEWSLAKQSQILLVSSGGLDTESWSFWCGLWYEFRNRRDVESDLKNDGKFLMNIDEGLALTTMAGNVAAQR